MMVQSDTTARKLSLKRAVLGVLAGGAAVIVGGTFFNESALAQGDVIAERKAGMRASSGSMRAIKAVIDKGGPTAEAGAAAAVLVEWYKVMPPTFPVGSDVGDTKALPVIWTENAAFLQEVSKAADEASKLVAAASAGDIAAMNTQFNTMARQCGACHDKFRAK
jgi:cytochrome c556